MKTIGIIFLFVLSLIANHKALSQQAQKPFLIIPGDIHRPYEILGLVAHVKTVESCIACENPFESSAQDALKDVISSATKYGADAVINTTIQFFSHPGQQGHDEVLIYGTMIKFVSDSTKSR